MTGYEAFCLFQSIKLHFTSKSYDFFKYNGKSNITLTTFENRKDKYHYHKLSRKYPTKELLIEFLVANFLEKEKLWVGDLLQEEADIVFVEYQKVMQSLTYRFENECQQVFDGVENPNTVLMTNGEYPELLTKALRKEISFQTLCLLNNVLKFVPYWDRKIEDDIRWPVFRNKIEKYAAFLPQDEVKYKTILKKVVHR
jgi:hypothetical protein